jgi:hypothetical protein
MQIPVCNGIKTTYMKLIVALLALLLATVACTKNNTNNPCQNLADSTSIKVKYHQVITLKNCDETQLKFSNLYTDSRCPDGAVCIWAGMAQIGVQLNNQTDTTMLQLYMPKKININGNALTLTLAALTPHPSVYAKYDIMAYEATITIKK